MIRIYIETHTDEVITLDVLPTLKIEALKHWLTVYESISLDQRKLMYGETQLAEDDWTMSDYDIQDESQIQIVSCETNGAHFTVETLDDQTIEIDPDTDQWIPTPSKFI